MGPSLQLRGEITANNKYTNKSKIEFFDDNQRCKENKKRIGNVGLEGFFNGIVRKDFTKKLALEEGFEESEGTSFVNIWGGGVTSHIHRRASAQLRR